MVFGDESKTEILKVITLQTVREVAYNTNVLLLSTVLASTCSTYRQAVRRMTISLAQFIVHERTVLEGTNEQFC
jgi:hypothetical protein